MVFWPRIYLDRTNKWIEIGSSSFSSFSVRSRLSSVLPLAETSELRHVFPATRRMRFSRSFDFLELLIRFDPETVEAMMTSLCHLGMTWILRAFDRVYRGFGGLSMINIFIDLNLFDLAFRPTQLIYVFIILWIVDREWKKYRTILFEVEYVEGFEAKKWPRPIPLANQSRDN